MQGKKRRNIKPFHRVIFIDQALDEEEVLNEVDETTFSTASGASGRGSNRSSSHIEMPNPDDSSTRPNSAKSKSSMLTEKSDARERRKVSMSEQGLSFLLQVKTKS